MTSFQIEEIFVKTKIIKQKKQAYLVEWVSDLGLRRGVVPHDEVDERGFVKESILESAIPYGVEWQDYLAVNLEDINQSIQSELRRQGIWTLEDLKEKRNQANLAFKRVLNFQSQTLYKNVKNEGN